MTDNRANIKVSREFYERHKDRKGPGQTWEEYLEGQAPEPIGNLEPFGGEVPEVYGDTKIEEVLGRLDDLETSIPNKTAKEVEERFKQ